MSSEIRKEPIHLAGEKRDREERSRNHAISPYRQYVLTGLAYGEIRLESRLPVELVCDTEGDAVDEADLQQLETVTVAPGSLHHE